MECGSEKEERRGSWLMRWKKRHASIFLVRKQKAGALRGGEGRRGRGGDPRRERLRRGSRESGGAACTSGSGGPALGSRAEAGAAA